VHNSRMNYLGVVLLVAAVATAFVVICRSNAWQGRRSRAVHDQQLALAKGAAEADVTGFGEELQRLAIEAEDDPNATDEYDRAKLLYARALQGLADAAEPDELCQVTETLEEGRWTAARLAARAAGEPLPPRRPPCFFNPGHGPSSHNIAWQHRSVPACAADAARVEAGADPYIRTVERDDHRVPYWEGGPTYAGWARGYYTSWRGSTLIADVVTSNA